MSALQDILDKMYVDPELLEQLGEEQKQILFIKMREEQLRRWRDNEARVEQEQKNGSGQLPKKNRRGIKWLTGKDGEVWTWVMGDHPADMTIEQIIDKEAQEQARKIAEKEVLLESFSMDVPFSDANLDEQQLKNQLMQINLASDALGQSNGYNPSNNLAKRPTYSPYEEVGASTASTDMNPAGLTSHQLKASRKSLPAFYIPTTANDNLHTNQQNPNDLKTLNGQHNSALAPKKTSESTLLPAARNHHNISPNPHTMRSLGNQKFQANTDYVPPAKEDQADQVSAPPPIPQRPANLRRSGVLSGKPMMEEVVQFSRSYVPGFAPTTTITVASNTFTTSISTASIPLFPVVNSDNGATASTSRLGFNVGGVNVSRIAARLSNVAVSTSSNPYGSSVESSTFYTSNPLKTQVSTAVSTYGVNDTANGTQYRRFSSGPISKSSAKEDDDLYDNNPVIPNSNKQNQPAEDPMVRLRSVLREQRPALQRQIQRESSDKLSDPIFPTPRNRVLSVGEEIEKRQSKILEQIREQRDRLEHEAEADEQRQKTEWEEQERKAREAEAQIRLIAQKAREQHRRSLRTSSSLLPVLNDTNCMSLKEAMYRF